MIVELAHDVRGTGPTLVLIHGITEDRRSWDPLTNDLAHDHRVLRVDLRGHGASPAGESDELAEYAADIAALVDEPPLLVGHSLGGAVATAYAAAHESRGVIDVDPPVDLTDLTAEVRVPFLALFGIDPGAGYRQWLADHLPQARMELWDGLGHYPHLVEPQRFLDLVRTFEGTL